MPAKWYRIDTASQRGIHETIQSTISDFYHHFYFQLAQNLSPLKTSPPPSCPLLLLASIERRNRTRQLSSWYRVVFISFLFRVGTDGAHSRHDRVKAFLSWRTRLSVADSGEREKERKRERERE